MSTFPGSPRVFKGGIVLVDPETAAVQRVIVLQYNPDTLTPDAAGPGRRRRRRGPQRGAAAQGAAGRDDQARRGDRRRRPARAPGRERRRRSQLGLHAAARALETHRLPDERERCSPTTRLAGSGTLEIAPLEAPLTLFVWSKNRVVPVRLTDFSITEEAFDPTLNPIRAKVSLGLRVLSVDDLGFDQQGRQPLHGYQQHEGAAGVAQPPAAPSARSASTGSRDERSPAGAARRRSRSRRAASRRSSRYHGVDPATCERRDGAPSSYLRRRFVPPPERFALLQEHTVVEGDRLDNLAAPLPRRPGAVLAHLRRERRHAARRADRGAGPAPPHHACPRAFREPPRA